MSPDDELTRDDTAALAGVRPDTWSAYVTRDQAPPPTRHVGRTPVWRRGDVEAWMSGRPGRGRTKAKENRP